MKTLIIASIITIFLLMSGCASSSYTVGSSFSTENVKKIIKNKTSSAELISLFGQPYSKYVISANEVKWIYMHISSTSEAQSYLITTEVKTKGQQKTLDILLKDGVVINFTFTNTPIPTFNVK